MFFLFYWEFFSFRFLLSFSNVKAIVSHSRKFNRDSLLLSAINGFCQLYNLTTKHSFVLNGLEMAIEMYTENKRKKERRKEMRKYSIRSIWNPKSESDMNQWKLREKIKNKNKLMNNTNKIGRLWIPTAETGLKNINTDWPYIYIYECAWTTLCSQQQTFAAHK